MSLPKITIRVLSDAAVEALARERESWAVLWQHVASDAAAELNPAESDDGNEPREEAV